MKNFIEVVKANKGAIIKRGLIVAGTIAGLAIVGALCGGKEEPEIIEPDGDNGTEEKDEGVSQAD